jgi:hypothetical protein
VWLAPSDSASKLFFGLRYSFLKSAKEPIMVAERNRELAAIDSVLCRPY